MGKNINILVCMMVMCVSMYAMELERIFTLSSKYDYESLTYNTLHDIYAQQQRLHSIEVDCDVTSFSLKNMHKNFSEMSDDYKCVTLKKMSTQLLLLSCVATHLPEDVVRHICLLMMDGEIASDLTQKEKDKLEKEIGIAADELYITPIGKVFDKYHPIKVWLVDNGNSTAPIGPLYVLSHQERDAMLGIKSRWYSSVPVIGYDEKKLVDGLDADLKHTYLQGKEVVVAPEDWTKEELCIGGVLIAGPCVFCLCIGGGVGIAAACCGNPGFICTKPYLIGVGVTSSFLSIFSCVFYSCTGLADVTNLKRTTI